MNIKDHLRSKGYDFEPEHIDGAFHEFKTERHKGWYIGKDSGTGVLFTWGTWFPYEKFSITVGWSGSARERDAACADLERVYKEQKAARNSKAWRRAQREFAETQSVGASKYLLGKALGSLDLEYIGVKTTCNSWGDADLIIPMRDVNGEIWNLQRIQPNGFKQFMPGGRTEGLFFNFPTRKHGVDIFLCEGFATAASVYLSIHKLRPSVQVVCAFSAANLAPVAKLLRPLGNATEAWAKPKITLCADNDHTKSVNIGLSAAKACLTDRVVDFVTWPVFGAGVLGSDFNDAWALDQGTTTDNLNSQALIGYQTNKLESIKGRKK